MSDTLARWNKICKKFSILKGDAFSLLTYPILHYYATHNGEEGLMKGATRQFHIETDRYNRVINTYRMDIDTIRELWRLAAINHDDFLNVGVKNEDISLYHRDMLPCPAFRKIPNTFYEVTEQLKEQQVDLLIKITEKMNKKKKGK